MAKKKREIYLKFNCVDCGKEVVITTEEKLFLITESQMVAETQQLHCEKCIR